MFLQIFCYSGEYNSRIGFIEMSQTSSIFELESLAHSRQEIPKLSGEIQPQSATEVQLIRAKTPLKPERNQTFPS